MGEVGQRKSGRSAGSAGRPFRERKGASAGSELRCFCGVKTALEAAAVLEDGVPAGTAFFWHLEDAMESGGAFTLSVRILKSWRREQDDGRSFRLSKRVSARRIEWISYFATLRRGDDEFDDAPAYLREIAAGNCEFP